MQTENARKCQPFRNRYRHFRSDDDDDEEKKVYVYALIQPCAFRLNEPEHDESFQFERVSHFVCIQFYVHQKNIHKSIPFHQE